MVTISEARAGDADWVGLQGLKELKDDEDEASVALTACKEKMRRINSGISKPRKETPNASFCSSIPAKGTSEPEAEAVVEAEL